MTDQIFVGVDVAKDWLDIHHKVPCGRLRVELPPSSNAEPTYPSSRETWTGCHVDRPEGVRTPCVWTWLFTRQGYRAQAPLSPACR
jgi:hypothetical protein